jgi:hypothetical protein
MTLTQRPPKSRDQLPCWSQGNAVARLHGGRRGPYVWDVAHFLTGALSPDDRREAERDPLGEYVEDLRSHGVDAPPLDDVFVAHLRQMMHGYLNILTPVEMQPDWFAIDMDDLDTLSSFN